MPTKTAQHVDQSLGRDDYFAYWTQQAQLHATKFGWHVNVSEVADVLATNLGRDWLESEARRPERLPAVGAHGMQPLGQMIAIPSERNVARLLELGIYLKHCLPVPGFSDVVAHLRTRTQFEAGRLQLALGYRLLRVGCTAVAFEPEADRGRRADLAFDEGETKFLMECYAPTDPRYPEYDELLGASSTRLFEAAAEQGARVIVRIDLASAAAVNSTMRKQIERDFAEILRAPEPRAERSSVRDGYTLEVIDTRGVDEAQTRDRAWSFSGLGTWIQDERWVPPGELAEAYRTGRVSGSAHSWVVITRRDAVVEFANGLQRLAERVEQKVAQVRREGARGVIVVQSAFAGAALDGDRLAWDTLARLGGKVLGAHRRLAAVWLTDEGADESHRPRLGGVVVEGRDGRAFTSLVGRVTAREAQRDILDDAEIESSRLRPLT